MTISRIRTSIPVQFEGGEISGNGVIRNLGLGGLFVSSRSIPEHGDAVALHFELPQGDDISLVAMVWWTTNDDPIHRLATPGFGLRLIDENEAYTAAVRKLLD